MDTELEVEQNEDNNIMQDRNKYKWINING
jgi:hypothetical protein